MLRSARAFAVALLTFAAQASAETLAEVYSHARVYDATLASARQTLAATQERIPQGRAGLLPLIQGTANQTWNDLENRSPGRPFNDAFFQSRGLGVSLSQPLYRPANWIVFQQSELQVLQAEANFAQAQQDLILRVSQAYFDLLAAQDALQFTLAKKAAIAEQLAAAKRNFEVGTATITDTNEAQARFDLTIAEEIVARNDIEVRRRALTQLTGRVYAQLAPLPAQVPLPEPTPNDMGLWVERATDQAFPVRAGEAALEFASKEIERNRAGHKPTVDLVAQSNRAIGASAITGARTDTTVNAIGLQLAVPFFQGGLVDSRVREAIALRDRARFDLEGARRSAEFQTRQSFLNYTNGVAQVRALEQALRSSELALASNKLGYEVGVRINIDVLNAEQQVFQTRRDLSRARYDTLLSGLRLRAAAGSLVEADVTRVNEVLLTR